MDRPLTDRRRTPRFSAEVLGISRATLRPGCPVDVVDLGPAGAQLQSERPLRPGSRVHVRLPINEDSVSVGARVLRCFVAALDTERGVTYRGALEFDHPCAAVWELVNDGKGESPVADRAVTCR